MSNLTESSGTALKCRRKDNPGPADEGGKAIRPMVHSNRGLARNFLALANTDQVNTDGSRNLHPIVGED
jgi:hypothetical protein